MYVLNVGCTLYVNKSNKKCSLSHGQIVEVASAVSLYAKYGEEQSDFVSRWTDNGDLTVGVDGVRARPTRTHYTSSRSCQNLVARCTDR